MTHDLWENPATELEQESSSRGTPADVKAIVQELLRNGYIESTARPSDFYALLRLRRAMEAILEPLDLEIDLDEVRGIAVLRVAGSTAAAPDETWNHPLVRRQRFTLEQSLLVAILRQFHVMQELENGIGVRDVRVTLDELLSQLQVYLTDTGSDAKNRQRLLTLLDQLKPHGIVSEPDSRGEVTIRPLITRLANPETLTALLHHFRSLASEPTRTDITSTDE